MNLQESIYTKKSALCRSHKKENHSYCDGYVLYQYGSRVIKKDCICKCHKEISK